MKRKTYGVFGLMDWTTQIKAGKATFNIHFTGGALTAYGVTPATFSTSDILHQAVIENSSYFKSGRIHLVGEMEVSDNGTASNARIAKPAKAEPAPDNAQPLQDEQKPVEAEPDKEADAANSELKQVQMTDLGAAKDYLAETFGISRNRLRSKKQIVEAAAANGIELVIDE